MYYLYSIIRQRNQKFPMFRGIFPGWKTRIKALHIPKAHALFHGH